MHSRIILGATLVLLLTMSACVGGGGGGGGNFVPPPPPGSGPFSNASFSGNYAFAMSGNDNSGFFTRTGSLVADGKGNFTGIEDVNSAFALLTAIPISGSYSIGPDGRGTLVINHGSFTTNYRLTVVSTTQVLIVQDDNFATASGNLAAQNTASFNAGLGGNYTFDFSGVDGVNPLSIFGAFSANANLFQDFETDMNDGGSPTQTVASTGNFSSVDPTTGRGTASIQTTLGNLTFAYYIVSPAQAFFISTNSGAVAVSGTIFKQQPPVGGFVTATFSGDYAALLSGASTSGAIGDATRFHADGISAISAGLLDENNDGARTPSGGLAFTGTFTPIDAKGRGTITLNTNPLATFVFYLISPKSAVIQETDSSIESNGAVQAQAGGPFGNASLKTHFALNMSGAGIGFNGGRFDMIGDLAFDGAGNITGAEITNNQSNVSLPGNVSVTGTYSLAANGRGTLTLNLNGGPTLHFAIYVPDGSTIYFQGTDSGAVVVGIAANQNF